MIHTEAAKKRFEEILGKNAAGFASTVITLYKSNRQMQECDGASIMQAALTCFGAKISLRIKLFGSANCRNLSIHLPSALAKVD